jgi:tRNA-splicing ligase RtcB
MEYNLKPIAINRYRLLQNKKELPAVLFLSPQLLSQVVEEQAALRQLADATALPGVINPVIGLPDIHSGFGLPIGGVLAADAQKGVISAGAVGMDINCGVRLLHTN